MLKTRYNPPYHPVGFQLFDLQESRVWGRVGKALHPDIRAFFWEEFKEPLQGRVVIVDDAIRHQIEDDV
jgi:hypothetical protein